MRLLAVAAGGLLVLIVLWDAFETIVLSRRFSRKFRLTRLFYKATWMPWAAVARRIGTGPRREGLLSVFGPLSLILLLVLWAAGLVAGFAFLYRGFDPGIGGDRAPDLRSGFYLSGSALFTLGLGDVTPTTAAGRFLTVLESGTGFAFLAFVIGYLPMISQAFSKREVSISLLDARAGSPPTAGELLRRHSADPGGESLSQLLKDWERWSAELLESHISFPVLSYFRSQHDNQSWIAALTSVLDACAVILTGVDGAPARAARLTFAMARHTVVDLCEVFDLSPSPPAANRLSSEALSRLQSLLAGAGVTLRDGPDAEAKLASVRALYEPYANALSEFLLMPLPPWLPPETAQDNWQKTA